MPASMDLQASSLPQELEPAAVSQDQINKWRQHPATRKVLLFLRDSRQQMSENIAASVMTGTAPTPEYVAQAALRCEIMGDIETIDAETINRFYGVHEEEGESDAN